MSKKKLCLNCGSTAMPSIGTVDLCPKCQSLIKNTRGVEFQTPKTKIVSTP